VRTARNFETSVQAGKKKVQDVDFLYKKIGFGLSVKNGCCSIPSIFVKQILNMGSSFVRNQATRRWRVLFIHSSGQAAYAANCCSAQVSKCHMECL